MDDHLPWFGRRCVISHIYLIGTVECRRRGAPLCWALVQSHITMKAIHWLRVRCIVGVAVEYNLILLHNIGVCHIEVVWCLGLSGDRHVVFASTDPVHDWIAGDLDVGRSLSIILTNKTHIVVDIVWIRYSISFVFCKEVVAIALINDRIYWVKAIPGLARCIASVPDLPLAIFELAAGMRNRYVGRGGKWDPHLISLSSSFFTVNILNEWCGGKWYDSVIRCAVARGCVPYSCPVILNLDVTRWTCWLVVCVTVNLETRVWIGTLSTRNITMHQHCPVVVVRKP